METLESNKAARPWRRLIVMLSICDAAAVVGLIVAYFLTRVFRSSAPWVLPSLVAGLIAILVLGALLVLPRRGGGPQE